MKCYKKSKFSGIVKRHKNHISFIISKLSFKGTNVLDVKYFPLLKIVSHLAFDVFAETCVGLHSKRPILDKIEICEQILL
jgi:hypothetical protein